jgi:hypothetical protein
VLFVAACVTRSNSALGTSCTPDANASSSSTPSVVELSVRRYPWSFHTTVVSDVALAVALGPMTLAPDGSIVRVR